LLSKSRKQENVFGRMIYYKILREQRHGFQAIAHSLNKNHATVIHAIKTFDNLYDSEKELRQSYEIIKEIYFDIEGNHPLTFTTRPELIEKVISLEKQNKSLNLSNEMLKDSLKNYQQYDEFIELIKERCLADETKEYVYKKLNMILNGIHRK
tara:strand:+ start:1370 stop:1828 length:459 start_codon:yes stop_codon:yes gene_type:complete